jgi:hypothetical protein
MTKIQTPKKGGKRLSRIIPNYAYRYYTGGGGVSSYQLFSRNIVFNLNHHRQQQEAAPKFLMPRLEPARSQSISPACSL